MVRIVSLWVFIMIVFWPFGMTGQEQPSDREIAIQTIKELKEGGTLIVVLPSDAKKIAELDRLIASPELSEGQKKKLKKHREKTQKEEKRNNLAMINAFETKFDFSSYLYIYDYEVDSLINKSTWNTLNTDLETISIPAIENYWLLFHSTGSAKNRANHKIWIIKDKKMNELLSPFPNRFEMTGILNKLFLKIEKKATNIVINMNSKFHAYYKRHNN